MPVLHKSTFIYADFEEVIAKTDDFVCSRLYNALKNDEDIIKNSIIKDFFTIINQTGEDYIPSFSQTKRSLNPLVDVADISEVNDETIKQLRMDGMSDNDIVLMLCDQLYDDIMSHNYTPETNDLLKFTNVADSIKILLKDMQLQKVYIYVKIDTPFIHDAVYNFFMDNDKIVIVTGDKEAFFNSVHCDTYLFKDIADIQFLPKKGETSDDKADVIMLMNEHNLQTWIDMRDGGSDTNTINHSNIEKLYNVEVSVLK